MQKWGLVPKWESMRLPVASQEKAGARSHTPDAVIYRVNYSRNYGKVKENLGMAKPF
jgi:hypothetical protein